ncbi:hypothetical protein EJ02DRAFT_55342 [Clathrospora elynae]|uniref:Uncharacterized protein n=1 Tax=Clathrospora elynae TaxID=706981 RepID=A0A6A5S9W5_9PLEO|nr:hypothetical protein EJ02DRAFT_55342 [Clathrospora elynae]
MLFGKIGGQLNQGARVGTAAVYTRGRRDSRLHVFHGEGLCAKTSICFFGGANTLPTREYRSAMVWPRCGISGISHASTSLAEVEWALLEDLHTRIARNPKKKRSITERHHLHLLYHGYSCNCLPLSILHPQLPSRPGRIFSHRSTASDKLQGLSR